MSWEKGDERGDAEQRVAAEITRHRERGEPMAPLECEVKRGLPCTTFWGRAWCDNLLAYSDFEQRLPRGRSYLRDGRVFDLEVMEGEVFAYVAGAGLYDVSVFVEPLAPDAWEALKSKLAGKVSNLLDLLGGKLGAGALETITDLDEGLFPKPAEIRFDCNCPDFADMCKHAAAVLYGVGVKLDSVPELFFKLRKLDHAELVGAAGDRAAALAAEVDTGEDESGVLAAENLGELFGIELAEPESAFAEPDNA